MKSILIRLGKVFNSLRRDGVVAGGRKIFRYFVIFFKAIVQKKYGDILLITGGVGDSARFRAWNVAEELNMHGTKAAVAIADDPFLQRYADRFKIFIFHRTIFTPKIKKFFESLKNQKKEIIFDADDLLFDPKYYEGIDYLKNINALEKQAYGSGLGREILTDPYVRVCTTTTSYLADILKDYGKQVFIVPNKLSEKDLKITDKILAENSKQATLEIKIGYFSGSISHNKDFSLITEALMVIMEKFSNVRLILAGPLELEDKLDKFEKRITRLPFAPRAGYFENISKIDINLAPLEIGDPFCESKSELKFFEAGILGIPTVAARNRTFSKAITDGADGFLASTKEEWVDKLEKLITDDTLRSSLGEKAREKVSKDYTTKSSANVEYYNYLKSKL